MDLIGTAMGVVTIPMALLTAAGVLGGLLLAIDGAWWPLLSGLLALGVCALLARLVETLVVAMDDRAARALLHGDRGVARLLALASGMVPVALLLAWEIGCFRHLALGSAPAPGWVLWLWSYLVATGPWTLLAARISRFRRTLCGIRAYAGHIGYWLLSALVILGGAPLAVGAAAMLLPAILPVTVGLLLAVADREALTNVRV